MSRRTTRLLKALAWAFPLVLASNVVGQTLGPGWAAIWPGADPDPDWPAPWDGEFRIGTDGAGNVFSLAGHTAHWEVMDPGAMTLAYDSTGQDRAFSPLFHLVSWNESVSEAGDMVVDDAGNTYVAVYYHAGDDLNLLGFPQFRLTTLKYNAQGALVWSTLTNPNRPVITTDGCPGRCRVRIDASGNVYVAGHVEAEPDMPAEAIKDVVVLKYTANGADYPGWSRPVYDGDAHDNDLLADMAVGSSGGVYVTAQETVDGEEEPYAYVTLKYDEAGNQVWRAQYHAPLQPAGRWAASPHAIALSVDGVYVVGEAGDVSDQSQEYVTVKYNADDGTEAWTPAERRYHGPFTFSSNMALDCATDPLGNVYVTGLAQPVYYGLGGEVTYGTGHCATVSYAPDGTERWVRLYRRHGGAYGAAIAVNTTGTLAVTGRTGNFTGNVDAATVKYTWGGTTVWHTAYDGGYGQDSGADVAIDDTGYVYVTGQTDYDGPTYGVLTIKYGTPCNDPPQDSDGDEDVDLADFYQLQACYNGPNRPWKGPDHPCRCLDSDHDGDVDLVDYTVLQGCFNGPNNPPKC